MHSISLVSDSELLKELINEVGMDFGNARIECSAKTITRASIHFINDGERSKFIRSANMLKKELRGRKIKITKSMDAEESFHNKRMENVKYCIHMRQHSSQLDFLELGLKIRVSQRPDCGKKHVK